ncbi:MAG: thioesterase family protein [Bacteroidales bacterium]|jgi:predicted thioesterase|nr:thioesterase family protein [Bacteroidales bacterium]
MEINLPIGIENKKELIVNENDTAIRYNSGEVNVLATPRLLAFMEEVAYESVKNYLPKGCVSVGVEMHIYHLKSTSVGKKISCQSYLLKQEGKKLFFNVVANDEKGKIGEGSVVRYIVEKDRFELKAKEN